MGGMNWGITGGVPDVSGVRVDGPFYAPGQLAVPSFTNNWKPFTFRKSATMAKLICVGGGAAGGGGFQVGAGTAKGGGGGGGSGAIAIMDIPLSCLPRTIFLFAGPGGSRTAAAFLGVFGNRTVISDSPGLTAAQNIILVSGTGAAGGGSAGVSAGSSAGGPAETAATQALGVYMAFGQLKFIAGVAGTAAGASATPSVGVAQTWGAAGTPLGGGTGGGGVNTTTGTSAGGLITGSGLFPAVPGGVAAGGDGQNGRWNPHGFPFMASGGTGGGGSTTTGGAGGPGAPGCGGGGGGGGTGAGGISGAGGPGFITIVSW